MGGLTTNDIAAFVTLALLLALVLVLLLHETRQTITINEYTPFCNGPGKVKSPE